MSLVKYISTLAVALTLTACGGGGGNPGAPSGGTGTGTPVPVAAPTLTLTVVDANGVEITDHVLSQTREQKLKIILKNTAGAVVPYAHVTVELDSTQAVLVPGSGAQLTNTDGIVLMRIAPTNVNSEGAVKVTASVDDTVDATVVESKTYSLQITPGTVGLSKPTVSSASVEKGQSINVSAKVTVNGLDAASNSVAVTFSSLCGTVSPSPALVDSSSVASAVIQTNVAGNCAVTASAGGVTSSSTTYTVTSPPITGIQFVSATPELIYQKDSPGINTSIVKFKVIDSQAKAVQGKDVQATLTNTDGGINFCGSPSSVASDTDGFVTFTVCGGTLPATVQVRATLVDTATIFTDSNLLTVQTGMSTQRFFDISATKLNIFAGGYFTNQLNGNTTEISVFAADRQGNPVPNGTRIVFVTEGGQINTSGLSSCLIAGGRCTVSLIGQNYRPMGSNAAGGDPRPGRVTVLAYADGEEYFIDANNNNRYDSGELFEDLGSPYVDKDENQTFVAAYTNRITGTSEGETTYTMPLNPDGTDSKGTLACPTNSNLGLSAAGTCNKKWDGYSKVRRQIVVVFSGDALGSPGLYDAVTNPDGYDASIPASKRTQVISRTRSAISVQFADRNGNPLPSDATVSTEVTPSTSTCKATLLGSVIGNTTEPTIHTATLDGCSSTDSVRFKVTAGTRVSALSVAVP